ncbi:TonB-dependent receptor [Colwellia sp. 1_MG-2023]|uniref:TonB-dependent receptor n=1 Tax=Colwellia sp. 1_MG-2023 TaxID=3062649 RepID=UPI0026E2DE73|nr:TonB-dependent receptor [Colwellia sp. 1_MG-2023]MDO6446967.1 TonB-dependent receptor [Colwellia sp. 1_MG-2023]
MIKTIKVIWGVIGFTFCMVLSVSVNQALAEDKFDLQIDALPVADALKSLSYQTKYPVLFQTNDVNAITTNAISGSFTLQQALAAQLKGTSLSGGLTKSGVITISQHSSIKTTNNEGINVKTITKNKRFKNSTIATAIASSLMLSAGGHAEETTTQDQIEVIEVIGSFRGSLNDALMSKRESTTTKDEIFSEDMGKFPDLNLAEAIQRVSGVAIRRDNGEGVSIELRGLGSNFTNTLLHGMPIATAANEDRGASLDIFPSELFTRISIEKSALASQSEGGIAGVIDMRNARPFDFDGEFNISTSLQGGYNDLSKELDPRGHLMASKTWEVDGNRFGFLAGAAYSKRYVRVDGWESQDYGSRASGTVRGFQFANGNRSGMQSSTWDTVTNDPNDLIEDDFTSGELEQVMFPRLQRTDLIYGDRKRLGTVVAFQWEPADSGFNLSLDWLHSELDDLTYRENFDVELRNSTQTDPVNITADANGYLLTGTMENVNRRSESRQFFDYQEFDQFVLEASWQATDLFTISAKAGYNESAYDERGITYLHAIQGTTATIDYTQNTDIPSVISNVDISNPDNYVLNSIRVEPEDRDTANTNFNLDFEYGHSMNNIKFGIAYTKYEYTNYRNRANHSAEWFADQFASGSVPIAGEASKNQPFDDFSANLGRPNGAVLNWQVTDWDKMNDLLVGGSQGLMELAMAQEIYIPSLEEVNIAYYLEVNNAFDFLDREMRTNAGVRYIETSQETRNFSNGSEIFIDREYEDILPSFNLAWDATDEVVLRFSAGRTLTRPPLSELEGSLNFYSDYTVSGNNPYLKPYYSNQFDTGVEWYFADESILAFNFFYKNITGFLETRITEGVFSEVGVDLDSLDPDIFAGTTPDTAVTFEVDENSTEPRILKGYEIAFQMPFDDYLPIDGVGMMANYTFVDSSDVTYNTSVGPLIDSVVGQSENTFNLVAYYETNDYSVRASYNYRSDFTENGCCRNGQPLLRVRDARGQLDFSGSYAVSDNVDLNIEVINATNEEQYTSFGQRLNRVIDTGRQLLVGVRANF